jgi:plastocyanin
MRIRGRMRAGSIVLVLATGLGLASCSSNDPGGSGSGGGGSSAAASAAGGGSSAAVSPAGGGSGKVDVRIQNFSFDPSTIEGTAGATLTIDVSNKDGVEHGFTLDDGGASKAFQPGTSGTVRVTLPDSGSVGWHCQFHPSMTGTIEVS